MNKTSGLIKRGIFVVPIRAHFEGNVYWTIGEIH
jgi:hypothetical protein